MALLIRNNKTGFESGVTGSYAVKDGKPVIPAGHTLVREMSDEDLIKYTNEKEVAAQDQMIKDFREKQTPNANSNRG